jgi:ribosomal protein S18 acetylase RimI-like enzyme
VGEDEITAHPVAMAAVTVRRALAAELRRAGEVCVAAYSADGSLAPGDPYAGKLADAARRADEAELLVAVDGDGTVVGSVTVCPAGTTFAEVGRAGEVEFRMLAVDPAAHGRGVGTALVSAVLDRARELGASRVVLSSAAGMAAARRLYDRMGFTRLPERDWEPVAGVVLLAYGRDL